MKIKLYIILLFEIVKIAFNLVLDDIQVYGGNYGSNYKFIIYGKSNETLNESNIKINLSTTETDMKEAECSIEKNETSQILIFSCIYNENIDRNVSMKKQNNNIFGIEENQQIKPLNLSIEYLEAKNLEFENEIWEYELKGKVNEPNKIYLGICYMDIKINDTNAIAGCDIINKNESQLFFNCKINGKNQSLSNKITIPKELTVSSTLKFNNLNDTDMNIIAYKDVSFIEGKNLTFNKDKWEFSIIVPYQSIPLATKSIVDILYNGFLSSATCYSINYSILDCFVNEETQNETDLVKIHFISSDNSTITWNDLTYIYEIPIEKELTYTSLTKLKYIKYTKVWSYTILFSGGILPENSLVTINIKMNGSSTLNKCYYINSVLNCKTEITDQDVTLKLSYEKNNNSITWKNIIKKDIPFTINVKIYYENSFNLNFYDNTWNFILNVSNYTNIYRNLGISIGIKYGQELKEGVAYCFLNSNDSNLFDCEVFYENQTKNDLIIIYGESSTASVTWSNNIIEKKITTSAQLNFSKAYDLTYLDGKWNFKIKVEDNDLPNGSKLIVDILYDEINDDTATCIYNNTILSCERDSSKQEPTESLILKREKGSGSITWEGIEKDTVTMPITIKKNLIKAYDLIFSENWNFYIEIQSIGVIPNNAYFLLDILYNNKEITAKCELSNKTHTDDISIMFCYLDIEGQSRRDEIKINIENKYGSIIWLNNITNFNDTISELSSEHTNFFLKKAYNMEFRDHIWEFELIGDIGRNSFRGEIFTIEIKYIVLEGEFDSIAKCWSKGGFMNEDIHFLCNVEYENQTDKGLIQLKYFQSEFSTLIWNGGIEDNYQITLKGVSLVLVKAYDMTLDKTWKFKIDVEEGIFPSGAQIIIDIFIGKENKSIYCTSLNNSLIICDTGTSSQTDLIRISNETLSNSSFKWNENRQGDFLIFLNIEFDYINAYNLIFNKTINKWIFIIKKKGKIPLGSKLLVDIKYNNLSSIAKCFNNITADELNCFVEEEDQNEKGLVQLNHIKSKRSSITWTNLKIDEPITLITNLIINKALKLRKGEKFWIFEIIIEGDIPNNSKVIIDIYYKINSIKYDSTAICYYNNKTLYCTT